MKFQIIAGTLALSVAGLLVGCGDGSSNTKVNVRTNGITNMGTNNATSNAVVVNNNTSSNTAANRWNNANTTREEYDKNRSDYEKDKGTSTVGTGLNDSWLWFKTRAALLATSDLRESTINVDVVNEVITLKGTVATAAQKTKAQEVASGIEGKKKVVNELKVAPNDSMTNTSTNSNSNSKMANKK